MFKNNSGFYSDVYNPIIEGVLNLTLSLVLVQSIGLPGVIVGTIFSNVIIIHISKPLSVFTNCFDKKILDYIKVYGVNFILTLTVLLVSNFVINYFDLVHIVVNSWLSWFLYSLKITFVISFITITLFLSKRAFRVDLTRSIRLLL